MKAVLKNHDFADCGNVVLTLGIPGSGKTYLQQLMIHRMREKDNKVNVFIITPNSARDYFGLIKAHDGEVQVFPHLVNGRADISYIEDLCRASIDSKQDGLFYQADIGTMAGSLEEVQRNAWACLNVIEKEIDADPDAKYILAIDDAHVLFRDRSNLYSICFMLLELMRNARKARNCTILLAGDWDEWHRESLSLLLSAPNASALVLPIDYVPAASKLAEMVGISCRQMKKIISEPTSRWSETSKANRTVMLVHPHNGLLRRSKAKLAKINASPEEHSICSNAAYHTNLPFRHGRELRNG